MTYFADNTEICRFGYPPGTKMIGWLDHEHEFEKVQPTEETLDLLWNFCKVSVRQTRGFHNCELCVPAKMVLASRKDSVRRFLGTSEIMVFSKSNNIYAAPTLVYHYVNKHHYKPPDDFLAGLHDEPRPPSHDYFDQLRKHSIEWNETSTKTSSSAFKLEKVDGALQRVPIDLPVCFDET